MIKFIMSAVAALNLATTADATPFSISFNDGGNNVGSGMLNVESGYAISGYFDVTVGLAAGEWILTGGTPASPGSGLSPNGYFTYDNIVYPDANPHLTTTGGLLFTDGLGDQLNMWADAPDTYSLWAANNAGVYYIKAGSYPGYSDTTDYGFGNVSVAPEPGTCALTGFGLLLIYLSQRRKRA